MELSPVSRRTVLRAAGVAAVGSVAAGVIIGRSTADAAVTQASPFPFGQVKLTR